MAEKKRPKSVPRTQGEQLANLELRAELDPYLENNPIARLGYDVLMRGYVPGEGPSGKIYSVIADYASKTEDPDAPTLLKTAGLYKPEGKISYEKIRRNLEKQGVDYDPGDGATVYFQQRTKDDYKTGGLETLMHELAHVGFDFLRQNPSVLSKSSQAVIDSTTMNIDGKQEPAEEIFVDVMEGRSRQRLKRPLDAKQESSRYTSRFNEVLQEADRAANEQMLARGMPPQAVQRRKDLFLAPSKPKPEPAPEQTIMERLLGIFN